MVKQARISVLFSEADNSLLAGGQEFCLFLVDCLQNVLSKSGVDGRLIAPHQWNNAEFTATGADGFLQSTDILCCFVSANLLGNSAHTDTLSRYYHLHNGKGKMILLYLEEPSLLKVPDYFALYDAYVISESDKENLLKQSDFSDGVKDEFWNMLSGISSSVQGLLARGNDTNHFSIYLAECGTDRHHNREYLRKELLARGYRLLPESALPAGRSEFEATVKEALSKADLSLHIISANYSDADAELGFSKVDLQLKLAANYSKPGSVYVWIPAGLLAEDPSQKYFTDQLIRDDAVVNGAEIVLAPTEVLKTNFLLKIKEIEAGKSDEKSQAYTTAAPGRKKVYLISRNEDTQELTPIRSFLKSSALDLLEIDRTLSADEQIKLHRRFLKTCDGVFIFCGSENDDWLKVNVLDYIKAPGYGREFPIKAGAVYLAEGAGNSSLMYDDLITLNGRSGFDASQLFPFMQKLTGS